MSSYLVFNSLLVSHLPTPLLTLAYHVLYSLGQTTLGTLNCFTPKVALVPIKPWFDLVNALWFYDTEKLSLSIISFL